MGSTTTAEVAVHPLTAAIGAEISGVDLATAPDRPEIMELVHDALVEHLVLFFRDQQHLTPDQQIRFAGLFGPFEFHAFAKPHPDHPELVVLDQTTPERDGSNSWHTDSTFMEQPAWGSVLRAVQLPPTGGDTCWASMYGAYEALSPRMRTLLDGCTASHDLSATLEKAIAGGHSVGTDLAAIRAKWPPVQHPVVRVHPVTGRKSLFVNNNFTTRILGVAPEESAVLLPYLLQHVQRPDFQVRFQWQEGSVALWDNRCTQHYAVPDYSGHRRIMHRVTLTGERPTGVPVASSSGTQCGQHSCGTEGDNR